jgi:hypothetical protein
MRIIFLYFFIIFCLTYAFDETFFKLVSNRFGKCERRHKCLLSKLNNDDLKLLNKNTIKRCFIQANTKTEITKFNWKSTEKLEILFRFIVFLFQSCSDIKFYYNKFPKCYKNLTNLQVAMELNRKSKKNRKKSKQKQEYNFEMYTEEPYFKINIKYIENN